MNDLKQRLHALTETVRAPGIPVYGPDAGTSTRKVRDVLRLLRPLTASRYRKIRVGSKNDGGYIMLDEFSGVERALSLGVERNDDWDASLAERGIQVYQYDDSIDFAPTQHPLMRFEKLRIVSGRDATEKGITLTTILSEERRYILKMDIENAEWECLAATPADLIGRCSQLIVEFHNLRCLSEISFRNTAFTVFSKIAASHWPIHIHANNCSPMFMVEGVPIPDVIEVTFVSKSLYEAEASTETFPTELDAPNDAKRADYYLGSFSF